MAGPDASGGFLQGHGVGFALVAIFAGVALTVVYAASDGAIFGQNAGPAGGLPVSDPGGRAAVISRDSFDVAESAPIQQNVSSAPVKSNTTLSEEQRRLLANNDFPGQSVAGGHIASSQNLMDGFGQPVTAEPGVEPLAISDRVLVNVDRVRDGVNDDLELADIIDGVIDIEVPIDIDNDEGRPDEQPAEDEDQEEPLQDDNQGAGSGDGNQTGDDGSSGENSGDEGSGNDDHSGEGSGGNSTSVGPSEDSAEGSGNSTSSE